MKRLSIFVLASLTLTVSRSHAQWVQTNGPYGGIVECLAVNGTNLFAGTDGGGVFRSTNNGTSWRAVNAGLPGNYVAVYGLGVIGTNLFAGTAGGAGVYRSTDSGTTWTAANNGLTGSCFSFVAIGSKLFAGTNRGIYLSIDDGATWTSVSTGLPIPFVVRCFAVNGTNLFAGGESSGGIYRSTNDGTSWTVDTIGLPVHSQVEALAAIGTNLFAGMGTGAYRSTDSGATWTKINTGLLTTDIRAIAVSGSRLIAGTFGAQAFLSIDSGAHWTSFGAGLDANIFALAITPTALFAGSYGNGVFRSLNNGTFWVMVNTGLAATSVEGLVWSGSNLVAGTFGGQYYSTDRGATWSDNVSWSTYYTFLASGSDLFAGTIQSVYRSTDDGVTWTPANTGMISANAIFALLRSGSNLFAGGVAGIFRSANNGGSWSKVSSFAGTTMVYSLAVTGTNIFAGTRDSGVYRSTDNGTTWTPTGLTGATAGLIVYSLATIGPNVFAGTYNKGAFRSTDSGATWTAIDTGLTTTSVKSLAVSGFNLFAGSGNKGLFLSTNNGSNWSAVNSGLTPPTAVPALAIGGPTLFAGLDGGSVWHRGLAEMTLLAEVTRDTQTVRFSEMGGTTLALSGDSAAYRAHRIDFVNNSGIRLAIADAVLTTTDTHFSVSQILPSVPDTVAPGEMFSVIVHFTGDISGTVYRDTVVLTINHAVTSYYVYLNGNSFGIDKSGVPQTPQVTSTDFRIYPNPFTQWATISFTSPERVAAQVTIVNLLGVEVARIFSGELDAGEHSLTWDASGMAPGMYFVREHIGGLATAAIQTRPFKGGPGGAAQIPVILTR